MKSIYFPDFDYSSGYAKQLIINRFAVVHELSYDDSVVVAFIRPPLIYNSHFKSFFPNLKLVLSDTTGVSHLSEAVADASLLVKTLRDVSSEQRLQLTAAADHAFTLLSLSLRPILSAYTQFLQHSSNPVSISRRDYIGFAWQDVSVGILGFGRIGQMVFHKIPKYVKSVRIFDTSSKIHTAFPSLDFVDSPKELFRDSDVILIAITDDPSNCNFVDSSLLANSGHIHSIVNISRPHIVCLKSILDAITVGNLFSYFSDFWLDPLPDIPYSILNSGRILFLPHMGGCTRNSWSNSIDLLIPFLTLV